MHQKSIKEIQEDLGINLEFPEKLLLIEKLTVLAQVNEGDSRYENLSNDEELPGSMTTTAFRLRSLLLSLTAEEKQVAMNYLGKDYWCPSEWSAGSY